MQFACALVWVSPMHVYRGRFCMFSYEATTRQLTRTSHFVGRRSIHLHIVSRLVSVIIFIAGLSMQANLNKCRAFADATRDILHCTVLRFQVRGLIGICMICIVNGQIME